MKLIEFYTNLKDKIDDDNVVKENFQNIFAKYKKTNNANKDIIEDLEKKFFAGEKIVTKIAKKENAKKKEKSKVKIGVKRRLKESEEDSLSVVSEQPERSKPRIKTRSASKRRKPAKESDEEDFNDEDSEY